MSIPSKVFTRILLNRIVNIVDQKLRREQAGFRKNRSCVDQINTLRIIVEQCQEWNATLYLVFVDFLKAFDSLKRKFMWKALARYGIPEKIINLIKSFYENYRCQVIHEGKLTEPFEVNSGVKQGCILSPTIFLITMDLVMREAMFGAKTGLQWKLMQYLEDLDFADDVCVISQSYNNMQEKLNRMQERGARAGMKINCKKTKEMRINSKIDPDRRFQINGEEIETVTEFQYLGSIVTEDGGAGTDVKSRIKKANFAFIQLYAIWKARDISTKTKLRIFRSNVKAVLLYGCETWKVTTQITRSLQVFVNRCLRRILRIHWPETITNEELLKKTGEKPMEQEVKRRKWGWIGHCLRKEDAIEKEALRWNPQGARKRGRPRMTWRRSVEEEMREDGKSWTDLQTLAKRRNRWRTFVAALCSERGHRK